MDLQEINARFSEINSRPAEEPTPEDRMAIEAAEAESGAVPLEQLKNDLEQYSGRIVLRIPRSLHRQLKNAAAMEGVSLNQYMLYKLSQ